MEYETFGLGRCPCGFIGALTTKLAVRRWLVLRGGPLGRFIVLTWEMFRGDSGQKFEVYVFRVPRPVYARIKERRWWGTHWRTVYRDDPAAR